MERDRQGSDVPRLANIQAAPVSTTQGMLSWMKLAAITLILIALSGCSQDHTPTPNTPSLKPECGVASYYHPSLAGNLTANGETYRPAKLTAAHRTLPFGTKVRVTRLDTNTRITVTINDRGPFVNGRIIDLSSAAAKKLNIFSEEGVAIVCLDIQ